MRFSHAKVTHVIITCFLYFYKYFLKHNFVLYAIRIGVFWVLTLRRENTQLQPENADQGTVRAFLKGAKKSPLPDFRFYTIGGLYKKAEKYVLFSAEFLFPPLLLFLAG